MEFRKTVEKDIDSILEIIKQAQSYLKSKGINQWQNNYPNYEIIKEDINNEYGYVLADGDNIAATVSVSFDGEKTYENIYEGSWLTNDEFAVIHRIALHNNYKGSGMSTEFIKYIEELCLDRGIYSIKVDTHEENLSMQNLLKRNDFKYCGIIYLEDGNKRVAFEKCLKSK